MEVKTLDLELAKYLSAKQFQPHEWAINDCNTFIVEWIDEHYGTDFEGMLQFNYDSALGAAKYHKRLPFTAEQFMYIAGFDHIVGVPQNGDVLLQNLGPWFCAWLVLEDTAYTIDHKAGFVYKPAEQIEDYSTWRRV
jgi:hypothetical protein